MATTPNIPPPPPELGLPEDFGAEIANEFAKRQVRPFDPNAQRGTLESDGNGTGITTADGGSTVDAWEQLAAQLNAETIAERSPVVEPPAVTTTPSTPVETANQPGELPPPVVPPTVAEQPPAADDGQQAADVAPVELPPPAASSAGGYVWNLPTPQGEQTFTFTDDQVRSALALADWANNLPDATRQTIAAIEDGQAVAVPRSDYDRFQAWHNTQARTQRDADLSNYDEDAAKEIARLRDQLATTPPPPPPQQQYANLNGNLDRTAQLYDAAIKDYQATNQLTQQELDAISDVAVKRQFIRGIAEAYSVFNPLTGDLVTPADPRVVVPEALNAALALNPALHESVLIRKQTPPSAPATAPSTTPPTTPTSPSPSPALALVPPLAPTRDNVETKKSRAASVASAPSAAVPPAPRNTKLEGDALVRAMAAELATHMGRDDDFAHVSAPTAI